MWIALGVLGLVLGGATALLGMASMATSAAEARTWTHWGMRVTTVAIGIAIVVGSVYAILIPFRNCTTFTC